MDSTSPVKGYSSVSKCSTVFSIVIEEGCLLVCVQSTKSSEGGPDKIKSCEIFLHR